MVRINVSIVFLFHLSMLPPCGQKPVMTALQTLHRAKNKKAQPHDGHFFTAAISKFIEIDWFLQIIVKLILPLNMKLERGFSDPNIKTGGSWLAVKMFL